MPITPSFSVTQSFGAPNTLTLTDTSSGSDSGLTSRRVYLQMADGTYLVPDGTTTDYIEWAIGDINITIDVLDQDYALQIIVQWMTGTAITYSDEGLYLFYQYAEQFYYNLTQFQASIPLIPADTSYYNEKIKLRVSIDEAKNAVFYNDIAAAQNALNRAKFLIDNQNLFF